MTPEEIAAAEEAARIAAAAAAGGGDDETKAELERTREALKAANRESADRRKRLEALEAAEAERVKAAMTETDRLKAEKEEAEKRAAAADARANEKLIRAAFIAEAAKSGVLHPEDVYLLADRSQVQITDTDDVTGVAEAVKALVDSGRVPLSGRTPAPALDGGAGGGDRHKPALTAEELEMARKARMTPEQYAKRKAEQSSE